MEHRKDIKIKTTSQSWQATAFIPIGFICISINLKSCTAHHNAGRPQLLYLSGLSVLALALRVAQPYRLSWLISFKNPFFEERSHSPARDSSKLAAIHPILFPVCWTAWLWGQLPDPESVTSAREERSLLVCSVAFSWVSATAGKWMESLSHSLDPHLGEQMPLLLGVSMYATYRWVPEVGSQKKVLFPCSWS